MYVLNMINKRLKRILLGVIVIVFIFGNFKTALAISNHNYTESELRSQGILFFDPGEPDPESKVCSSGSTETLSNENIKQLINENRPTYEKVAAEFGIDWRIIAALHYRETSSISSNNPKENNQGIFQLTDLVESGKYNFPAGKSLTADEFLEQTRLGVDFFMKKTPGLTSKIKQGDPAAIKEAFARYNGYSTGIFAQNLQAAGLTGLPIYEGSAYVMNKYDPPRQAMKKIGHDHKSDLVLDSQMGAYTLYEQLGGPAQTATADAGSQSPEDASAAPSTQLGCADAGSTAGGIGVSPDGFVFPLTITKSSLANDTGTKSHWNPDCDGPPGHCHHDYYAADIFAKTGTIIIAARGGVVTNANFSNQFGQNVQIKAEDGLNYYYTHMPKGANKVNVGDKVSAGQAIGEVGTSENASGTDHHLHIDITKGKSRPSCSGAACSNTGVFLNPSPVLKAAYQGLPK